jgi:hypothetical protein
VKISLANPEPSTHGAKRTSTKYPIDQAIAPPHIVAGENFDVACTGDGVSHGFRKRRRAHPIKTAADHEHGAPQTGQFALHAQARQHSPDLRIARGIVGEPSRPVSLKALDVAAKLRGIAIQHRIGDGEGHAGGLDIRDAFKGRSAAIRRDAGSRAADHDGTCALRVWGSEMKCDRTADGNTHQRDLAGDPENIERREKEPTILLGFGLTGMQVFT